MGSIIKKIKRRLFLNRHKKSFENGINNMRYNGNTRFRLADTARISLGGSFDMEKNDLPSSGRTSLLRMDDQSRLITHGSFQFMYGADVILFKNAVLSLGKNSFINSDCKLRCHDSITIGDDCAISHDFTVMDSDAHHLDGDNHTAPVRIGDHVWIGTRVTVLSGVHIGDGAVITAGAVVTEDIPPGCLAGGIPARVIRENVKWSK